MNLHQLKTLVEQNGARPDAVGEEADRAGCPITFLGGAELTAMRYCDKHEEWHLEFGASTAAKDRFSL